MHKIIKCSCGNIISQCRCPAKDKPVEIREKGCKDCLNQSQAFCELCGEPMPEGEEVFKFHGYSGDCPKPPLPVKSNH